MGLLDFLRRRDGGRKVVEPSKQNPLSIAIWHKSCQHAQDVLVNCTSWDQAAPYMTRAQKRGSCKTCGRQLTDLVFVIVPNVVAQADPDAIDLSTILPLFGTSG